MSFGADFLASKQAQPTPVLGGIGDAWNALQSFRQGVNTFGNDLQDKESRFLGQQPLTPVQHQSQNDQINSVAGAMTPELTASSALAKAAPQVGKALGNVGKVATGKGLWEGIVDAAKNPINWNNVQKDALTNAKNEQGPVRDALDKILADEAPSNFQVSGNNAVEQRASAGQMIPKNFWGQSNLDSAQSKAYAIYRDALSRELKLNNLDLGEADKLYGLSSTVRSYYPKIAGGLGVTGLGAVGANLLADLFNKAKTPGQ